LTSGKFPFQLVYFPLLLSLDGFDVLSMRLVVPAAGIGALLPALQEILEPFGLSGILERV
jgi:hypothetical protein